MRVSIHQLGELTKAWMQIEAAKGNPVARIPALAALAVSLDSIACAGPFGWAKRKPSSMAPGEFVRYCAGLLPELRKANSSLATFGTDVEYFSAVVEQVKQMDRANA